MPRRKIELSTTGKGNVVDMKTGKPVELPILPVICERIRFHRELMGMEQRTLAQLIGVTANSVSNWENGRSRPDVNLLPAICNALNITFYDLFNIDDPTIKYSAREQMLIDKYNSLSIGHKHTVDNLVDTLRDVEALERCSDLKPLTYYAQWLTTDVSDPMAFENEGSTVYVHSSPRVRHADYIFTVNGNSMEPDFKGGQDVLVQKISSVNDLSYGEIVAFIVGNETYIKRYEKDGLHSSNKDYPTMRFSDEKSVYLIGRVLGILDKADYASEEETERYLAVHGEAE